MSATTRPAFTGTSSRGNTSIQPHRNREGMGQRSPAGQRTTGTPSSRSALSARGERQDVGPRPGGETFASTAWTGRM